MIILIKNNKDAFEACWNAINGMLLGKVDDNHDTKNVTYRVKARFAFSLYVEMEFFDSDEIIYSDKKIVHYRTLLRVFRLSRFMRFNILAPFCSAVSTLASSEETKKDKFLFGVKMFGLVLLSALILPVALVSHPITHSIGRIVSKIRGNKDGKVPPEDITFAEFFYKTCGAFLKAEDRENGIYSNLVTLEDILGKCHSKYSDKYKHLVIKDYFYPNGELSFTEITEAEANPCGKIDQIGAFGGFYR